MKPRPKFHTAAFIDAGLENYQQLIEGILPEVQPFRLDQATDGLRQIHRVLQQHPELKTVHIISHGSPGCLYLGNSQLSLDTLGSHQTQLQQWQIDNLLLYGCNVAAGDAGAEFVAKLQALTGAEIAATRTLTGAALQGGNWELEVTTGKSQPTLALSPAVRQGYPGVLNPQLEWAKNIGGSGYDEGRGIATDSSGNVLVTGAFQNTIDIDSDGNNDLTSNGSQDSYVAKLDSNGNLVWAENIGGSGTEWGWGIATDSSGNVLVTGSFQNTIDIDSDGNNDLTSNGSQDSYVAKLDSDGNLVFAQNIGGSGGEWGWGIATDSSGNILATGDFQNTIDIDSDGNNDLTSNGGSDSYVAKLDSDGNLVWAENIGGSSSDQGIGIATDSSGNILATGSFQNTIDIDSDGNNDLTSNGGSDSYVAKLDSDGNLVWAENIGGSGTELGIGIATDSSSNVLVTGAFENTIDIDSDGNNDLTSNGSEDSYVAKLDSDGNLVWAENIGGSSIDYGIGIATDSSSNVLVTGAFQNTIDIDSDGNNDLTSNGSQDSYVAKLDSDGNLVWAENIVGSGGEWGWGIATDSSGNVLATGNFSNTIDIDSDGNNDLTSSGRVDSYVVKFSDNSPPTDLNLSPKNIDENEPANTQVGTFSTTDPDTGDTFTYELVAGTGGTDNNAFTITNNQLQIDASPDYETQSSYSIRVKTTDAGGLSYEETFTVEVNDLDEDETCGVKLKGTSSAETMTGSECDDTITGFGGNDTIFGEESNDSLKGGSGNDILEGNEGNDTLKGGKDHDNLDGGMGEDLLKGGIGYDNLQGGSGNDILDGGAQSDILDGDLGNDTLQGGKGNDTLDGGSGNDFLDGDAHNDTLMGGNGKDTLDGGDGSDFLDGGQGKDNIQGGTGKDTLDGGGGNDFLDGELGSDTLLGGSGNDILEGGEGDDLLQGGAGLDSLYGDGGSDTFVLEAGMGEDNVYSFEGGVDLLQLGGGYSFGDLDIAASGSSTAIKIAASGETLATLVGVNPASIDGSDFV